MRREATDYAIEQMKKNHQESGKVQDPSVVLIEMIYASAIVSILEEGGFLKSPFEEITKDLDLTQN